MGMQTEMRQLWAGMCGAATAGRTLTLRIIFPGAQWAASSSGLAGAVFDAAGPGVWLLVLVADPLHLLARGRCDKLRLQLAVGCVVPPCGDVWAKCSQRAAGTRALPSTVRAASLHSSGPVTDSSLPLVRSATGAGLAQPPDRFVRAWKDLSGLQAAVLLEVPLLEQVRPAVQPSRGHSCTQSTLTHSPGAANEVCHSHFKQKTHSFLVSGAHRYRACQVR